MTVWTLSDTCDEMRRALDDPSVPLHYFPGVRCYAMTMARPGEIPRDRIVEFEDFNRLQGYPIYFCPWTGDSLPWVLRYERTNRLKSVLGHDSFHDGVPDIPETDLPQEFQEETWWVSRNIREVEVPWPECNYWPFPFVMDNPPDEPWEPCRDDDVPVGYWQWDREPPHLCKDTQQIFYFARLYSYFPHTREFGFRIIDMDRPVDDQAQRILPVNFCPWCGHELPKSLREEWERRVRFLNLDPNDIRFPTDKPARWPDDLLSDTWWKKERSWNAPARRLARRSAGLRARRHLSSSSG